MKINSHFKKKRGGDTLRDKGAIDAALSIHAGILITARGVMPDGRDWVYAFDGGPAPNKQTLVIDQGVSLAEGEAMMAYIRAVAKPPNQATIRMDSDELPPIFDMINNLVRDLEDPRCEQPLPFGSYVLTIWDLQDPISRDLALELLQELGQQQPPRGAEYFSFPLPVKDAALLLSPVVTPYIRKAIEVIGTDTRSDSLTIVFFLGGRVAIQKITRTKLADKAKASQ